MQLWPSLLLLIPTTLLGHTAAIDLNVRTTRDDFLDVCLEGQMHLKKPSDVSGDYDDAKGNSEITCSKWSSRSCCAADTMRDIDSSGYRWYNLELNHCAGHKMSQSCLNWFLRDTCFYECSPDIGPWTVEVQRSIGRQRFFGAPLCQSECHDWYQACKDDYSCVQNWATGFQWKTDASTNKKRNHCPATQPCKPMSTLYKSPTDFCESVFDGSWRVVHDSQSCMRFATNITGNRAVAEQEVTRLLQNSVTSGVARVAHLLFASVLTTLSCRII